MEKPERKPTRLAEYDYSQPGAYFVTVCTRDRKRLFWTVGADIIRPETPVGELLSEYGKIAERAILTIPEHYSGVTVDQYVVMPNHLHLIVRISETGGRLIAARRTPRPVFRGRTNTPCLCGAALHFRNVALFYTFVTSPPGRLTGGFFCGIMRP